MVARYNATKWGKTNHDLIRLLGSEYGIKTIVQFYPLYRYELFEKMNLSQAECPSTDAFFDNMISFPFHSWMSDEDFTYMIESIQKALYQLRN